jgi:hypothetical protein
VKTEIILQYQGKSVTDKEISDKVKAASGKKAAKIEIYVQPENNCAYYTVDSEGGSDKVVELF